jgi:hypothetical protein
LAEGRDQYAAIPHRKESSTDEVGNCRYGRGVSPFQRGYAVYKPHLAGAIVFDQLYDSGGIGTMSSGEKLGARRHAELLRFIKYKFVVIDSSEAFFREVGGNQRSG